MFPYTVNSTTIMWMTEWPDEALNSVGYGYFNDPSNEGLI